MKQDMHVIMITNCYILESFLWYTYQYSYPHPIRSPGTLTWRLPYLQPPRDSCTTNVNSNQHYYYTDYRQYGGRSRWIERDERERSIHLVLRAQACDSRHGLDGLDAGIH